jgi:hypothetical protein
LRVLNAVRLVLLFSTCLGLCVRLQNPKPLALYDVPQARGARASEVSAITDRPLASFAGTDICQSAGQAETAL